MGKLKFKQKSQEIQYIIAKNIRNILKSECFKNSTNAWIIDSNFENYKQLILCFISTLKSRIITNHIAQTNFITYENTQLIYVANGSSILFVFSLNFSQNKQSLIEQFANYINEEYIDKSWTNYQNGNLLPYQYEFVANHIAQTNTNKYYSLSNSILSGISFDNINSITSGVFNIESDLQKTQIELVELGIIIIVLMASFVNPISKIIKKIS